MKFETTVVPSCCGKTSLRGELGEPITPKLISRFTSQGFVELAHFTKAGMMYVESSSLIITGPFGSSTVHIKCKKNCDAALSSLRSYLTTV